MQGFVVDCTPIDLDFEGFLLWKKKVIMARVIVQNFGWCNRGLIGFGFVKGWAHSVQCYRRHQFADSHTETVVVEYSLEGSC